MNKKVLLSLLLFTLATPLLAQDPDSLKDGVVKVRAGTETGTGFVLNIQDSTVFVLTALHVVEGKNDIEISFLRDPYHPLPATVVQNQLDRPEETSLSILKVETKNLHGLFPLTFSQEIEASKRQPVFAAGFYGAGNIPWSMSEGQVIGQSEGSLLFTGAIEGGNSGGPLLQDGQVVGVVMQKLPAHNTAVSAQAAEQFAESVIGLLPVRCNAPLIPAKHCDTQLTIDRKSCDYIKRANALYEDGEYAKAIAEYDKAIVDHPGYAVFYNNRGAIKTTDRDFKGAEEDYRQALQLDPDYTVADVNQSLLRYYTLFFQWGEAGEPPSTSLPELFSFMLKNQQPKTPPAGDNTAAPAANGFFGGFLNIASQAGQVYQEYLAFEDMQESFEQGDFACYGGDIIAANNELNRTLSAELVKYMENLDRFLKSES